MSDLIPTTTPDHLPASGESVLVAHWLQRQRSEHTRRGYQRAYLAFRSVVTLPLRDVTLPVLEDYAATLAASGLAQGSQCAALMAIKSLFSYAADVHFLPLNVGAALRPPRQPDQLAQRIVDRDSIAVMLAKAREVASPRDYALLLTLYYGGLRVSEAASLVWRDVLPRDAGRCQLTVTGKGQKTRTVLLPSRVWRALEALRGGAGDDARVFPVTSRQIANVVKAAAIRAGLPRAFSPHWCRHALASHSLDSGAPSHVVQHTLGHASLATTSRYAHARPCDSAALYLDR